MDDETKIAEFLNNIFINMVTKYIKKENRAIPEYDKLKTYIDSKGSSDAKFDIHPIEEEFVLKQLKDLNPKTTARLDDLSSKLLKLAAPAIASSVHKVINLNIKASMFPTLWKLARVCPI